MTSTARPWTSPLSTATWLTTLLLAVALVATTALAQSVAPIGGRWRTEDGRAVIAIGPCTTGGAAMCGRISRFLVPEPAGGALDGNNPDRALRSRPLLGAAILTNLTPRGGAWHGRGYSPADGRNFNATVTLLVGDRLRVRGCVAVFCRTQVWTRAS